MACSAVAIEVSGAGLAVSGLSGVFTFLSGNTYVDSTSSWMIYNGGSPELSGVAWMIADYPVGSITRYGALGAEDDCPMGLTYTSITFPGDDPAPIVFEYVAPTTTTTTTTLAPTTTTTTTTTLAPTTTTTTTTTTLDPWDEPDFVNGYTKRQYASAVEYEGRS